MPGVSVVPESFASVMSSVASSLSSVSVVVSVICSVAVLSPFFTLPVPQAAMKSLLQMKIKPLSFS